MVRFLAIASTILFAATLATGATPTTYDPTFLQKHVAFFDRNHDGVIYLNETIEGFRAIGLDAALSYAGAFLIHKTLSPITSPEKSPSPLLPIEIKNIALAKHGSDSGVYDTQGNFVASKFEEIFSRHAHTHPSALTSDELDQMLKSNRQPWDVKGWIASETEWKLLYDIGKDAKGLLGKDTIRDLYDGSLFEELEKKRIKEEKYGDMLYPNNPRRHVDQ